MPAIKKFSAIAQPIHAAISRHGGGWLGVRILLARSYRVWRAIGWKGLVGRIRASRQASPAAPNSPEPVDFPPASELDQCTLSVGVMAHVFYIELLDELAVDLSRMPVPYVLMVSVIDDDGRAAALTAFSKLPNLQTLHVRVVPNRGRDIAPFLLDFREEILALDLVSHIHTKKSLYSGSEQDQWRRYLLDALLGSRERIGWILGMFQAMPSLGMVYPESYSTVPWWAHTWLSNAEQARELGARLDIGIDTHGYIDYPAGSMFWARTEMLRPLFALDLQREDFPVEQGQTDGTAQHAVERLLSQLVRRQNGVLGILPADGSTQLRSEGERNWTSYFSASPQQRIGFAAIDAQIVSFDVFDTLVTRPFLHPSGARGYFAHLVEKQYGLSEFAALRGRVEASARTHCGHDVDGNIIYAAMARMPQLQGVPTEAIHQLELACEQRWLRPRAAIVEAAQAVSRAGKPVIGVSDMYLGAAALQQVLPAPVSALLQRIHVSCETGWRKDTGEAWDEIPSLENVSARDWLHVGDNEHSDVQLPQAMGFIHPVHTLRPAALLDLVPSLRMLRPPKRLEGRWQDQLWLGLLVNHFTELADRQPEAFSQHLTLTEPETLGYTAVGPLLFDYSSWLARTALENGTDQLLFLSREGYPLRRAFSRLQVACPALAAIKTSYLQVSRRAVNTPTLRTLGDLARVFEAPFTGPLERLLQARLGANIAAVAARRLEKSTLVAEVFLPEMRDKLIELLRPVASAILEVACAERETWLAQWADQVGDDSVIVADIGYAGTIQAQISRLTGHTLGGAYFAIKSSVVQTGIHQGWARARFHDERSDGVGDSPVMQHHLLLEALLTAPDGQFSHFAKGPDGRIPIHLPNAAGKQRWALIERIQNGAMLFIDDACAVTGEDSHELAFDPLHVQQPLHGVGSGQWRLGEWAAMLGVEDDYTGRGDVATLVDTAA
jgi:FMN phosphatase YigB (HAD superfamily)